jgi:large subunit ribosomal protein L18
MSIKSINRKQLVQKRHFRLRKHLSGTTERPRLSVYRSSKHIYAQLIDDTRSLTLTSASSLELREKNHNLSQTGVDASIFVGKTIAERAIKIGVKAIVFDRGGNLYHGRIKALADSARDAVLEF